MKKSQKNGKYGLKVLSVYCLKKVVSVNEFARASALREVVTTAYMLLKMYDISIDLACEGMLETYQQTNNPVPKGYLLN